MVGQVKGYLRHYFLIGLFDQVEMRPTGTLEGQVTRLTKKEVREIGFVARWKFRDNVVPGLQSIRDSYPLVNKMHQPGGSNQQELKILEEGWLFAFHIVAVELPNPRHH